MRSSPVDDWEAVATLVGELVELGASDRAMRLAAITDPAIRARVVALLAAHDTGGPFFDRPAASWLDSSADPVADPAALIGERIGPWRLTALIGQGGMGAVYRAERDEGDFVHAAAVKMLRPDAAPGIALDRFRRERQVLARLTHRNIATLFDGGVTPDGRPWFAMELVDGEPITRWCTRHLLAPPARLQLMRQVCAAVQHAHRALIVHRDIKPGNILVTADGTVKLLDFGIAKLLDADPATETDAPLTHGEFAPATPSYASPEHLDGGEVSTSSDIYSLGVVLYELLTGRVPFAADGDLSAHRRRVQLEPAAPPDRALRTAWAGGMGSWTPNRLRNWLRGDIARVLQMALRKEPERRYASAEQFADDLDAVITGRPVRARPDGAGYRLRRLVGRNPVATAVTLLLAAGLVVTATLAVNRARRAEAARVSAAAAAERAERVTGFLAEVLTAPDPWTGQRDVSVRDVLDQASRRAARDFGDDPAVEARVRLALAKSYRGLGQYDDAAREFRATESLDDPESRFAALRGLGEMTAELGDAAEARRWYAAAYVGAAARGDSLGVATVAADLAWLHGHLGHPDSARAMAELAVGLRRRHGASPIELANALNNFAVVELEAGHPDTATGLLDEAVHLLRGAGREGQPPLGTTLGVLAGLHADLGDFARAETEYRESLELRRRIFGEGHPDEIATLVNLAANASNAGRYRHAVAITDTILSRVVPGGFSGTHPLMAAARTARGRALNGLGDYAAARLELEQALELRRAQLPTGHPALAFTLSALAESYRGLGRRDAAIASAEEAYQILRAALGEEHPRTVEANAARGR